MPHIEQLVVQNYRVLKDVTLDGLQTMSVVLGPNSSGKSALFDVFGFLSDAQQTNVKKAIEPRGRLRELRSRGSDALIGITVRHRAIHRSATLDGLLDIVMMVERIGQGNQAARRIERRGWRKVAGLVAEARGLNR